MPHGVFRSLPSALTNLPTHVQVALKQWEASEEARRKLQHEIAVKLKNEREEQLVDKNSRRQNVSACV